MFKKFISVFIVIALMLSAFPLQGFAAKTVVESGDCGTNVTYTLYDDGELIIEGAGDMWDYAIYPPSPWKNANVKKVTIKKGVTSIGDYAFYYCKSLTSVTIPDSVTKIGYEAFYDCTL